MKVQPVTREVFVVYTNTDLTEGRGRDIPIAVCEIESTAIRLGKGAYVQGSDSPVHQALVINVDNQWYYPSSAIKVVPPTPSDISAQVLLEAKRAAITKAKAAGLTDSEIETLMRK